MRHHNVFLDKSDGTRAAAERTVGCRCARKVSAGGGFGPTGPQHSLKCQTVLEHVRNFRTAERVKEGERGRGKKGGREIRGREVLIERAGLRGNCGGPDEGMPKRGADTRPEHQT